MGDAVRTLQDHLSSYATCHRDPRNIATHVVGIPMIVLSILTLLAQVGAFGITPAHALVVASVGFYLALDLRFGLAMAALSVPMLATATALADATSAWVGVALFVVGWIIQFVGHGWEGRKPAFVDDLMGLLQGPLFLVAEAAFALGLRPELREAVNGSNPEPTS